MNKYLMSIEHYFGSTETFEIDAETKNDALENAKNFVNKNSIFSGGNYKKDTLKCIKKIQK